MTKNDTYDPIFTELLIFHLEGHDLHDLKDMEVSKLIEMTMVVKYLLFNAK